MKVDLLVDCDQKSLNAILPEGKKRKEKKKENWPVKREENIHFKLPMTQQSEF